MANWQSRSQGESLKPTSSLQVSAPGLTDLEGPLSCGKTKLGQLCLWPGQTRLSQLRTWADTPVAGPVQVPRTPKVLSHLGSSPGPRVGTVDSEVRHIQVTSWPRTPRSKGVHCLLTLQDTQAGTLVPLATEVPSHTIGMGISAQHTAQIHGLKQAPIGHHGGVVFSQGNTFSQLSLWISALIEKEGR